MDDLQKQLKRDAQALDGDVPEALRARIDAAIATTPRAAARRGGARSPALLGWSSAVAGLVAAAVFVVLLNNPSPAPEAPLPVTPPQASLPLLAEPLRVEAVRLTGPLQQELEHLRADLEKARDTIERDLRDSL